jgi:NAD-dependent dihydropyrimidine dehydrogenase PreA subunit
MAYTINPEACTFCKKCIEECPSGAIKEGNVGGKDVCVVTEADCIDCGACEDACETDPKALSYKE